MDFIKNILSSVGGFVVSLLLFIPLPARGKAFVRRYATKRTGIALLVVVVFLGFGLIKGALTNDDAGALETVDRQVQTAPAGLISQLDSVFESTGEIKSQTQGDLRAQRAGVITRVNAKVGERVRAGSIIASIENASERASVAQAQAGVAQAQASLNKVAGGTRDEQLAVLDATTKSAELSLIETQTSAKNTLLNAYVATDSAFTGGIDTMFDDADGANPEFTFTTTNASQATAAEHGRFLIQSVIDRHTTAAQRTGLLDAGALTNEINLVEREMFDAKEVLDNVVAALDGAVANATVNSTTIATYKTTATAARASVLSTLSALSTARGALNSAQSAVTVAQENEAQGITGAQEEDVEVAQAQLETAQASLAQSFAQLEDTRVRAPVTGVLTILAIEPGDFVTAFQDVGLVANDNALEIQTFVSSKAIERLAVGGRALIDGGYEGVITSIAPGLDPVKRQVEVRIALVSDDIQAPHGSRVSVEFLNLVEDPEEQMKEDDPILVPISALKLSGSDAYVFTVSSESTLQAVPVTLGEVIQASIQITEGITRDTVIVLDARGLNAGDSVIVAN